LAKAVADGSREVKARPAPVVLPAWAVQGCPAQLYAVRRPDVGQGSGTGAAGTGRLDSGQVAAGERTGGRERMGPCLQPQKNTLFPLIWKSAGKSVFFVAFYEIF